MTGIRLNSVNRKEVLRWLAFKGEPEEKMCRLMDECEKSVLEAVNGRYVYRVFDIEENSGEWIKLKGCGFKLTGGDISRQLKGCTKAVLLCATAGAEADRLIRSEQVTDMAAAVIIDAMAGCAVEAICDIAEDEIKESGMFMTWRFSAGYGDFPIEQQKQLLEAVNANRAIGVYAAESFVLTPKKSVTAVIGLSETPVEDKRHSCAVCNIREGCAFRQKGLRCYE